MFNGMTHWDHKALTMKPEYFFLRENTPHAHTTHAFTITDRKKSREKYYKIDSRYVVFTSRLVPIGFSCYLFLYRVTEIVMHIVLKSAITHELNKF